MEGMAWVGPVATSSLLHCSYSHIKEKSVLKALQGLCIHALNTQGRTLMTAGQYSCLRYSIITNHQGVDFTSGGAYRVHHLRVYIKETLLIFNLDAQHYLQTR